MKGAGGVKIQTVKVKIEEVFVKTLMKKNIWIRKLK